jgi:c-di-GMP-binding flagellar brake protein YcgR
MPERRRDERIALPLEAHYEALSGKYVARLSDVSLGGCYVESLAQVSVGETIRFEIQLPTGRWLPLQGEVVYHHPHLGFGVRFTDLSELEREMLASIIEYGSAN